MVAYANEAGEILRFNYIQCPDEADWFIDVSQASIKTVTVNGDKAELLVAKNPAEANAIAWVIDDTSVPIKARKNLLFSRQGQACRDDRAAADGSQALLLHELCQRSHDIRHFLPRQVLSGIAHHIGQGWVCPASTSCST